MGALLLPALNGQIDFFNGLYFNFLCLTAIDFGQLVPTRVAFLPITFLYVCLGLAITTIAIDVGSEYMKKLHYLGKKMKNAASTKIWFGGKTLKVRDLLHAVGKKCGVEPGMIDALDLENVVERTIAIQEGREPPQDTNEDLLEEKRPPPEMNSPPSPEKEPSEPSSSEDSPFLPVRSNGADLIIRNPVCNTLSNDMPMYSPPATTDRVFQPPMEVCRIEVPEEVSAEEVEEPHVIVVEPPAALEDIQLVEPIPLVPIILADDEATSASNSRQHSRSVSPEDRVPKKFKEKKEMYGRDPRKLFETYQEEWDRLERLSDKSRTDGFSTRRMESTSAVSDWQHHERAWPQTKICPEPPSRVRRTSHGIIIPIDEFDFPNMTLRPDLCISTAKQHSVFGLTVMSPIYALHMY
ncbi:hypothetical protein TELCIR_00834 [Teladorsagia circumcincta]|uniref:Potassium channel domain-containing protein n=1 Tax=Teladorsagia circumcincta TaxID=45464 RepID=A0A2G9V3R2_TELCI|nr:hypothetical protein TELCIR_00834 [Teladorsagia circumcincta]